MNGLRFSFNPRQLLLLAHCVLFIRLRAFSQQRYSCPSTSMIYYNQSLDPLLGKAQSDCDILLTVYLFSIYKHVIKGL